MIAFAKDHYTITRQGTAEEWLQTVRSLLWLMSMQDPDAPLSSAEVSDLCRLINDMLPGDDLVFKIQSQLKRCG